LKCKARRQADELKELHLNVVEQLSIELSKLAERPNKKPRKL
jgi:hypothetical protein